MEVEWCGNASYLGECAVRGHDDISRWVLVRKIAWTTTRDDFGHVVLHSGYYLGMLPIGIGPPLSGSSTGKSKTSCLVDAPRCQLNLISQ